MENWRINYNMHRHCVEVKTQNKTGKGKNAPKLNEQKTKKLPLQLQWLNKWGITLEKRAYFLTLEYPHTKKRENTKKIQTKQKQTPKKWAFIL